MATKALTNQKAASKEARIFIAHVYAWMTLALILSGSIAFLISNSQTLLEIIWKKDFVFYTLAIIEILLVFFLQAKIEKLSTFVASLIFIIYSLINGITLSAIFTIFKINSIYLIFIISSLMFAAMSIYGIFTKTKINSFFRYFSMFMIGIIIVFIINLIFKSDIISWIISFISVILFLFLTAYDTNKIVKASLLSDGSDIYKKAAVFGALELYLDFIGIFLNLLKLFGKEKD